MKQFHKPACVYQPVLNQDTCLLYIKCSLGKSDKSTNPLSLSKRGNTVNSTTTHLINSSKSHLTTGDYGMALCYARSFENTHLLIELDSSS